MARILIVEDEVNLARFEELELHHEGYDVVVCNEGLEGYKVASEEKFDLILLDLMLPGLNGLEICRKLRQSGNFVPIIMVSAKGETMDKVTGLDVGANDYIAKPYAIEELLARIRATIRNSEAQRSNKNKSITVCGLTLDPVTFTLTKNNKKIVLTKKEFMLLQLLMERKNVVTSRSEIFETIWGDQSDTESNVVDVFIRYLRAKIEDPDGPRIITTIRGIGYVIREE